MKVKFANRVYEVLYTKEVAGKIMYAIEDEPNHIDWLVNVEVVDPEHNSEDERTKKEIINYFKCQSREEPLRKDIHNKWIAWLENQGKEKSVWHDENEEPIRDSFILLIMQDGTPTVAKVIEPNQTIDQGERWAYIDDLLKK